MINVSQFCPYYIFFFVFGCLYSASMSKYTYISKVIRDYVQMNCFPFFISFIGVTNRTMILNTCNILL